MIFTIKFYFNCSQCENRKMCKFNIDPKAIKSERSIADTFGDDSILRLSIRCSRYKKEETETKE